MMEKIEKLFRNNIDNVATGKNGQITGLCPFHKDKHNSWSGNIYTGLWKCHACGKEGNAYQFAERLNLDPKPYINCTDTVKTKNTKVISNKKIQRDNIDLTDEAIGYY